MLISDYFLLKSFVKKYTDYSDEIADNEACASEPSEPTTCGGVCFDLYDPICACPTGSTDPALCGTFGNSCYLKRDQDCGKFSKGWFCYSV